MAHIPLSIGFCVSVSQRRTATTIYISSGKDLFVHTTGRRTRTHTHTLGSGIGPMCRLNYEENLNWCESETEAPFVFCVCLMFSISFSVLASVDIHVFQYIRR